MKSTLISIIKESYGIFKEMYANAYGVASLTVSLINLAAFIYLVWINYAEYGLIVSFFIAQVGVIPTGLFATFLSVKSVQKSIQTSEECSK